MRHEPLSLLSLLLFGCQTENEMFFPEQRCFTIPSPTDQGPDIDLSDYGGTWVLESGEEDVPDLGPALGPVEVTVQGWASDWVFWDDDPANPTDCGDLPAVLNRQANTVLSYAGTEFQGVISISIDPDLPDMHRWVVAPEIPIPSSADVAAAVRDQVFGVDGIDAEFESGYLILGGEGPDPTVYSGRAFTTSTPDGYAGPSYLVEGSMIKQ